ncbi:proprotein convertase P [Oscillochloris trichoides DG-6]|uniref:Proprotein convertase P n=1 Tax=Oscillochloris trichoides DG-6 TaxID=765420 RepID=E1IDH2_9CHLR|nr:proprotein convertase P [Oscillochloris trichoides DG-6]
MEIVPSVAWADVDSDGDLDLAIAKTTHESPGQTSKGNALIYANTNGVLSSTPVWQSAEASYAQYVAWGDIDNDGKPDLAVGNGEVFESEPTRIYHNTGTSLQTSAYLTTSQTSSLTTLDWGDVNGDGKQDLVVGNNTPSPQQPLFVYINDNSNFALSEGIMTWAVASWSPTETDHSTDVALVDVDQDLDLDLSVGNSDGKNRIYLNTGGTFSTTADWQATHGDRTVSIAWADIDADNDLDLIVGNQRNSRIYLNGQSSLSGNIVWENSTTDYSSKVAWGDMNGDGRLDLAVGNDSIPNQVFLNQNGMLQASATWNANETSTTTDLAWGDVDGDGDLDLAVGNNGQARRLYLNNGSTLSSGANWNSTDLFTFSMAWADADNDGDLDLAVGTDTDFRLHLNTSGTLNPSTPLPISAWGNTSAVAWGDVDGDGDLDLAIPNEVYRTTNGSLENWSYWRSEENNKASSIAWGDMDGDGDLDLAVGNTGQPNRVYRNDQGVLTSSAVWVSNESDTTTAIAWGDVDGDGDLDLAAGNNGQPLRIYRNQRGQLSQIATWSSPEISNTQSIAWGDMNGDGQLELAVANSGAPNRVYAFQQTPNSAANQLPRAAITYPTKTSGTGSYSANFFAVSRIVSGEISIPYVLRDAESNPANIYVEYSLNGGGSWLPATPTGSTVTRNLTTSATGVSHVFGWDTVASGVVGQSDMAVVRLRAFPSYRPTPSMIAGDYQYSYTGTSSFPFRLRGTIVRVVDTQTPAQPVTNALVYRIPHGQNLAGLPLSNFLNGNPVLSDQNGYVNSRTPLNPDDQLVAVQAINQDDSRFTFAYTSAAPTSNGLDTLAVGSNGGTQTLVVSPSNPLLLLNLNIGLEWDARQDAAFMHALRSRLQRTSEVLYDWSNGQVALGSITIYQNKERWSHVRDAQGNVTERGVDLRIYAANNLRPNATQGGIVNAPTNVTYPSGKNATYEPGYIRMGSAWNSDGNPQVDNSEEWARALAHEIGHYVFYLDETYLGKISSPDGSLLVPTTGCSSAMYDPYVDSSSEFRPSSDWSSACQTTLQHLGSGMSEWGSITHFYTRTQAQHGFNFSLNVPASTQSNPGPNLLPLELLQVVEASATGTAAPAAAYYGIIAPGGSRYTPSPVARAFIFPANNATPIDLGVPATGQVLARGFRSGDRLCLFDPTQGLFGCNLTATGLQLTGSYPDWQPEIQITPQTDPIAMTMVLQVRIPVQSTITEGQTPPTALQIRLFPREGEIAPVLVSAPLQNGFYTADIALSSIVEEGLLHIWVDESAPRREAISDYAIGGNPAPRSQPPRRSRRRAPAVSPDGQATIFAEDTTFPSGDFFALQRASSLPILPAWATQVGQGYRLLASRPEMLSQVDKPLALSLSYSQGDVPLGLERDVRALFHDGTRWTELETRVDTARNEAAVKAQPTPGIYVLVTSLRLKFNRAGWNFIYAYPGATGPVSEVLSAAAEQQAYTMLYGYDSNDANDPWKVFTPDPTIPAWVLELTQMQENESYWIFLSTANSTIALPIPDTGLNAMMLPPPPSTVYGLLDSSWGFTPQTGLSVKALNGTTVCGTTTTRNVGSGRIGFALDMLALDGDHPQCGVTQGMITIQISNGTDILSSVTIPWNNSAIREVGPEGIVIKNPVYLPLVVR